jgi:hypothetical protein
VEAGAEAAEGVAEAVAVERAVEGGEEVVSIGGDGAVGGGGGGGGGCGTAGGAYGRRGHTEIVEISPEIVEIDLTGPDQVGVGALGAAKRLCGTMGCFK